MFYLFRGLHIIYYLKVMGSAQSHKRTGIKGGFYEKSEKILENDAYCFDLFFYGSHSQNRYL